MHRRTFLTTKGVAAVGSLSTVALAGCADSGDEPPSTDSSSADTDDTDNTDNTDGTDDTDDTDGDSDDGSETAGNEFGELVDSQPTIEGVDANPDDPTGQLDVSFYAEVYDTLEDGDQFWEAEDGEAFLLGQFRIENVGEERIDFAPGNITVNADGEEGEWTVLVDGSRLNIALDPGDSVNEWQVYEVSDGVEEVEVTIETLNPVTATVEYDDSIEITFPAA
ncbi:hypothetical protein [Salinilacihabitans rarus]|uniref:hypothetical protein n=1 Tax=Salinilacihabitans rarus TaxID=2961596 RepID=UPI0020C8A5B8|nr:hypothetical protein [Salinilacihabitans rarus]